ncbi:MAG: T9SS type A sorting domain-containing protein [Chlorobi bacterium]|nr:T9SS type A sorting domain-containing protein [Chlorobiota bacterium]
MKTNYLVKVFFLLALFFGTSLMYAVDWENHVDAPCDDIMWGKPSQPQELIIWEGPYEYIICTDYISHPDFLDLRDCSDGCCYTVVYYDSWSAEAYNVYVAGIFWEEKLNADSCENCSKERLAEYFHWAMIQDQYANSQEFRDKFVYGPGGTLYKWSPGHCYDSLDPQLLCENFMYCCRQGFFMHLTPDANGDSTRMFEHVPMFDDKIYKDSCDVGCIEVCDDFRFEPIPGCEMPCNKTMWGSEQTLYDIPVPDCPDCHISITFKSRIAIDCDPIFNDYYVLSMDMKDPDCLNCGLTQQDLFQYGLAYLLRNGPFSPPADEECDIYWRIVTASCWQFSPDSIYTKCDVDGCCWSQFRICNSGGNYTYEKIDGSGGADTCWQILTHICGYVCDLEPIGIIQNPTTINNNTGNMNGEFSYAVPNPSSDGTEILFDYEQIGMVELIVYDKLGREVLIAKFEKSNRILRMPIQNSFSSGMYSYKIKLANKIIDSGSFIVIK